MHSFTSPLRYPGGKGMLAQFAKLMLITNNLCDGEYIEVYAGAAGIAWPLLFEEYVRHVRINDVDRSIIAFWNSVLYETDALSRLINDKAVTIEEWYRQKAVQQDPFAHSQLELAYSTFFLNRTNRSGIIKAGVIGGKLQSGLWRLDARFQKKDLIRRIQRIARYASRISIHNLDASEFITTILPQLPRRALVYLDPPYYFKGQGLYEHHYEHQDHVEIASLIKSDIRQHWIVSYDRAPAIIGLYQQHRPLHYRVNYSVQDRYAGQEVMFFSPTLLVPIVDHPTRVTRQRLLFAET